MGKVYEVRDRNSGVVVISRARSAESFLERLIGLMGAESMEADCGLWLNPANGIHTFGMRFPIDIVVMDREGRVVHVALAQKPNRILLPCRGGHSTLELRAGQGAQIKIGQRLAFQPVSD